MTDIHSLGSINGAEIALWASGSHQTILVQVGEAGRHLVEFLGADSANATITTTGDCQFWSVPHDERVDRCLKEIIDILISIRYLHPAFVQLQMQLL
jgi:hypothetical protein